MVDSSPEIAGPAPFASGPTSDAAAGDARVGEGVACIRCGYALTGLPVAGACPECGVPVARSLSDDRIADADPAWLDTVHRGLWLLAFGPISAIVAGVAALGTVIVRDATSSLPAWNEARELLRIAGDGLMVLMLLGLAAGAVGGVLVTTTEPRDAERHALDDPRLVARWGLMASVLVMIGWFVGSPWVPMSIADVVERLAWGLAVAGTGFGLAGLHAWFRALAVRVPAPRLAERCGKARRWYRKWTIFFASLFGAAVAAQVISQVGARISAPLASTISDLLSVAVGLGTCVALVVAVIAIFKTLAVVDIALALRSAIRRAVAASRSTAAATPAGTPAPDAAPPGSDAP